MKEMKEAEIKYYKNNFFRFGDGDFLEDFLLLLLELFSFFLFFFLHHIPKKDEPKNRLEGKPSGSILILLQICFSADATVLHFKQRWDADLDKVRL